MGDPYFLKQSMPPLEKIILPLTVFDLSQVHMALDATGAISGDGGAIPL